MGPSVIRHPLNRQSSSPPCQKKQYIHFPLCLNYHLARDLRLARVTSFTSSQTCAGKGMCMCDSCEKKKQVESPKAAALPASYRSHTQTHQHWHAHTRAHWHNSHLQCHKGNRPWNSWESSSSVEEQDTLSVLLAPAVNGAGWDDATGNEANGNSGRTVMNAWVIVGLRQPRSRAESTGWQDLHPLTSTICPRCSLRRVGRVLSPSLGHWAHNCLSPPVESMEPKPDCHMKWSVHRWKGVHDPTPLMTNTTETCLRGWTGAVLPDISSPLDVLRRGEACFSHCNVKKQAAVELLGRRAVSQIQKRLIVKYPRASLWTETYATCQDIGNLIGVSWV